MAGRDPIGFVLSTGGRRDLRCTGDSFSSVSDLAFASTADFGCCDVRCVGHVAYTAHYGGDNDIEEDTAVGGGSHQIPCGSGGIEIDRKCLQLRIKPSGRWFSDGDGRIVSQGAFFAARSTRGPFDPNLQIQITLSLFGAEVVRDGVSLIARW